jgi:hypothetical protein
VEQLDARALRGRPVIVAGLSNRGVVCAASYEARRFAVVSAMPTVQARKLCPAGTFVAPRFPRYEEISSRVFGIYLRYTPRGASVPHEAFLDVTQSEALHGGGREIALAVKRAVREEVGLIVSAGGADVKLAAKIATDLGKPDGLVVVPPGTTRAFLAPLPVSRFWGAWQGDRASAGGARDPSHRAAGGGARGAPRTGARAEPRARPVEETIRAMLSPTRKQRAWAPRKPSRRISSGREALLPHLLEQAAASRAGCAMPGRRGASSP